MMDKADVVESIRTDCEGDPAMPTELPLRGFVFESAIRDPVMLQPMIPCMEGVEVAMLECGLTMLADLSRMGCESLEDFHQKTLRARAAEGEKELQGCVVRFVQQGKEAVFLLMQMCPAGVLDDLSVEMQRSVISALGLSAEIQGLVRTVSGLPLTQEAFYQLEDSGELDELMSAVFHVRSAIGDLVGLWPPIEDDKMCWIQSDVIVRCAEELFNTLGSLISRALVILEVEPQVCAVKS